MRAVAHRSGALQGRFEAVHETLYSVVTLSGLDPLKIAEEVSLPDPQAFAVCAGGVEPVLVIEQDIRVADELGINAVPAVVFQGTLLGTPPDSAALFRLVEEAPGAGSGG